MKTVIWELLDKDDNGINFTPFLERASNVLDLSIEREEVLLTVDTTNLNTIDQKISVISLIKDLACMLNKNKISIITSQNDEMINSNILDNEIEVRSIFEDGFCLVEHKRKIENFSDYKTQKPFLLSKYYLPNSILDAKFIVPINMFDASPIFGIKGVVSSFFWFLPTYTRNEILIHEGIINRSTALLEVFSEINKKIIFSVNLLLCNTSVAVISEDSVAADAFTSALAGIKALSIPITKIANKQKLGTGDIMRLIVSGEKFSKPVTFLNKREVNKSITIDSSKCNLCMKCLDVCPFGAIVINKDNLLISKDKCNKCAYCIEVCPLEAIM